eukprot:394865-Rhodomonas_salina.1
MVLRPGIWCYEAGGYGGTDAMLGGRRGGGAFDESAGAHTVRADEYQPTSSVPGYVYQPVCIRYAYHPTSLMRTSLSGPA